MKTTRSPYSEVLILIFVSLVAVQFTGCSPAQKSAGPATLEDAKAAFPGAQQTALDEYVARPDPNYSYKLLSRSSGQGQTTFVLEMTSQMWLTTNEVNHPLWKHWLVIVKPDTVTSTNSLLFISGGSIEKPPPTKADGMTLKIALATRSVVTELKLVPNEPLVFSGETQERTEDAIIAYSWDKFLRTGDPKWPARLPMTKAAVRAMDTVTTFCSGPEVGNLNIGGFVVAGGSKRGWTTWMTAAVDKRVVAIVPIVIDVLNVIPSMQHHYAAYGAWAPSIEDYTALRIMDWMDTPQYKALMKIEDPYEYRGRFTMPKFLINASGDQFFLPDSSQFYFNDLPGVKYLRYVPNADHSLKDSDAPESLLACYNAILNRLPLPRFSWKLEGEDTIRVNAETVPSEVKLWKETNPDARDFRLETFGAHWESQVLQAGSAGSYVGKVEKPSKGWSAFFVELTFPSGGPTPFKFTTQVRVVPDTLPYKFVPKAPAN